MGFICGCLVGFIIYRGGNMLRLRWFFIFSTLILYLVAAGLMSKAVGYFEQYAWNQVIGGEAAEEGGDVIAYKVTTAVWHVSWGDPELNVDTNGGWYVILHIFILVRVILLKIILDIGKSSMLSLVGTTRLPLEVSSATVAIGSSSRLP